jgi:glycosyltransferase involved in cell wall biosynthesis
VSGDLPSASVVVAARNAERDLDACLRSLLALRYPRERLELVVVDNGSTDGTARVLARFNGTITVAHEERRGPAAARNAGIRAARGEVIALVDADCTVDPGWLQALVPALASPRIGIAGGRILAADPGNGVERFGETVHDAYNAVHLWRPPYVVTGNWAARRSLLDEVGMFDDGLLRCSDVDFSYRTVAAGYELHHCPDAVVYHRNERTLAGLFREGWVHGFHSVPIRRRHAALIAAWGPPEKRRPPRGAYARVFRTGKRMGRATARVRWGLR